MKLTGMRLMPARPPVEDPVPPPAEVTRTRSRRAVVDAKGAALTVLAVTAAIFLARYMQEVLIPFVLAGLVFYALDPLVDLLQRLRVPRLIGAGVGLLLVVALTGGLIYSLRDQALEVVEELPAAARKLQNIWASGPREPSALEKVQDAALELEKAAAAATAAPPPPRGVDRVQIEEPLFRASAYLRWGSIGMLTLAGQASLILLLTYFLLVNDDALKRKLVESIGPSLSQKKITVAILNDISAQIERFLLIQILVSAVVTVATGFALSWMGLRHPWVWGLAAGLFNTIPYLGPLLVSFGLGVVGFVQFGTVSGAASVSAVAFVITTIEGYWLTPALMGKAAQINRVAIFAGLLFWSWLWGVPGMLLAVPMMMVAKAVCDRVDGLQPVGNMLSE
jgi:predicted PurR-regulated permease PerM